MGYTANAPIQALYSSAPMERALRRITERTGEMLHDEVRKRTPVAEPPHPSVAEEWEIARKRVPGTLKESWYQTPVVVNPAGNHASTDVLTDDPVAPHVEWDTKPHIIRAKYAKMLRFWDRFGRLVFRFEVQHPGTTGQHMMRDALAVTDVRWRRIGDAELAVWAREQRRLVA